MRSDPGLRAYGKEELVECGWHGRMRSSKGVEAAMDEARLKACDDSNAKSILGVI